MEECSSAGFPVQACGQHALSSKYSSRPDQTARQLRIVSLDRLASPISDHQLQGRNSCAFRPSGWIKRDACRVSPADVQVGTQSGPRNMHLQPKHGGLLTNCTQSGFMPVQYAEKQDVCILARSSPDPYHPYALDSEASFGSDAYHQQRIIAMCKMPHKQAFTAICVF